MFLPLAYNRYIDYMCTDVHDIVQDTENPQRLFVYGSLLMLKEISNVLSEVSSGSITSKVGTLADEIGQQLSISDRRKTDELDLQAVHEIAERIAQGAQAGGRKTRNLARTPEDFGLILLIFARGLHDALIGRQKKFQAGRVLYVGYAGEVTDLANEGSRTLPLIRSLTVQVELLSQEIDMLDVDMRDLTDKTALVHRALGEHMLANLTIAERVASYIRTNRN